LNEVVLDFFKKLKNISRGYVSLDYEPKGYKESSLVILNILINKERGCSFIACPQKQDLCVEQGALGQDKKVIPRQLFDVDIQAAIGMRVIERESVKALRKNVPAKCYGGVITRKRKLLEKQ
jgi:GTP-binding protein LepA